MAEDATTVLTTAGRAARRRRSSEGELALCGVAASFLAGWAWEISGVGEDLRITPHLHGAVGEFISIGAQNVAVCLVFIFASHASSARAWIPRQLLDVAAITVVLSAGLTAGAVAAARDGLPHLPHAPLELGAVALSASWWWRHRTRGPSWRETRRRALVVALALVVASALETFAVPHVGPTSAGAEFSSGRSPDRRPDATGPTEENTQTERSARVRLLSAPQPRRLKE